MPKAIDAYRKGYEQGKRDGLAGPVSEAVFHFLRDDPNGYFAAGYRDGNAGRPFSPHRSPLHPRNPQQNPNRHWFEVVILAFFWLTFFPFHTLVALCNKEKRRTQMVWRMPLLAVWLVVAIFGIYDARRFPSSPARISQPSAPVSTQEGSPNNRRPPDDVLEGAPTHIFATASSVLKPQFGSHYDPNNVLDGRLDTAWVEGVPGQGYGQWIEIGFPTNTVISEIDIFPGYGKSQELFEKNSRPKKILMECTGWNMGKSVNLREELILQDAMKWQTFRIVPPITTIGVRFTIVDVYAGTTYEDTAISEIRFR